MNKTVVARKYARAFLAYGKLADKDSAFAVRLDALVEFLGQYRERLFHTVKESYLAIFTIFGFDEKLFGLLLDLLIQDKRLFLLKEVLKALSVLYKKHNNIEFCVITSSHQLNDAQKKEVHAFLERNVGKKIMYSYGVSKSLIAGIRARGASFVWEDSIARKLRIIEQSY